MLAEFSMHGVGLDTSSAAIKEAKRLAEDTQLTFTQSIAEPLPADDESQQLALDMMSHTS